MKKFQIILSIIGASVSIIMLVIKLTSKSKEVSEHMAKMREAKKLKSNGEKSEHSNESETSEK